MTPRLSRDGTVGGAWSVSGSEQLDSDRFGSRRSVVYGMVDRTAERLNEYGEPAGARWRIRLTTYTTSVERRVALAERRGWAVPDFRWDEWDDDPEHRKYRTRAEARDAIAELWRARHADRLGAAS